MLEALRARRFVPVLSEALVEELLDVLSRPRLVRKYRLAAIDIAEFAALLDERALKVDPKGKLRLCRDQADDVVLETALLGKAQYAVSRDDDLKRDLELMRRMQEQGVTVVSVSQFLAVLRTTGPRRGRS